MPTKPRRWLGLPPQHLAVLCFGYLGDMVVLQSALRGLLNSHTNLTVSLLAPNIAEPVLGYIDHVKLTQLPKIPATNSEAKHWLNDWLERINPDAIVAPYLHGNWGKILTAIHHPPRPVISYNRDQGLRRMRYCERLSLRIHKDLTFHELKNHRALFQALGLSFTPQPPELFPEKSLTDELRLHALFTTCADAEETTCIMLSPFAGQLDKEWTTAAWLKLIRMIQEQTAWRIVVNNSRGEMVYREAAAHHSKRVHALENVTTNVFIAWLSLCNAVVTVDSAPQHLAHALGLPSLTLYGPSDERRWGDYFKRVIHCTIRAAPADLTAEEKRGMPQNHEMTLIQPESVFETLNSLVSAKANAKTAIS